MARKGLPTRPARLTRSAGRLPRYASLVVHRARARLERRPAVAVLAGIGDANFGDEWMFEALATGLPHCRLVPLELPRTEERLARLGLSGPGFFSGLVVGGGTLINQYFLGRARPLIEAGVPAWTVGTGVGSAGFGVTEEAAAPEAWFPHLARFESVTVRGPRSVRRLAGIDARAVGDLALVHTPDVAQTATGRDVVLVNISGSEGETAIGGISESQVIDAVAGGVRRLMARGWHAVPLVVHRDDEPRLATLGERLGGWAGPPVRVHTNADLAPAMASAGAVVAMRLHASALGWMYGLPTVALGYRDKTRDFADHVEASGTVVDLRTAGTAEVEQAIADIATADIGSASAVHARCLQSRTVLRSLLGIVDAQISGSGGA